MFEAKMTVEAAKDDAQNGNGTRMIRKQIQEIHQIRQQMIRIKVMKHRRTVQNRSFE